MKLFCLIALLALASAEAALASAEPRAALASNPVEVQLPHISIVEMGEGPPVVLIPGLASPRAVWSAVAPYLARDHRVILVQVNGFAGDDRGANGGSEVLPGIVEDLAGYLQSRRLGKAAIIGHSMGGLVGMMLTRDHPQSVDRLMIVDALPFFGRLFGPEATVDSVRPGAEQMRSALLEGTAPTDAPTTMSNTESGRAQVTAWLRAADRTIVAQALYEDLMTDLRPDLSRIRTGIVHVLYGIPTSAMAPLAGSLYGEAYHALPNTTLVPVQASAHFIMLDQPDAFRSAVKTFLDLPSAR